ncbi:MAG: hypothetical protein GY922_04735 [Proteobacteria bacterium]|nr:hypothetical protein [Pseudomonadota bacterium]
MGKTPDPPSVLCEQRNREIGVANAFRPEITDWNAEVLNAAAEPRWKDKWEILVCQTGKAGFPIAKQPGNHSLLALLHSLIRFSRHFCRTLSAAKAALKIFDE